jgi:hypothetical protein
MAKTIHIAGERAPKGAHLTAGNGWRLVATKGRKRIFPATLLGTVNRGKVRIAIFSVPKGS